MNIYLDYNKNKTRYRIKSDCGMLDTGWMSGNGGLLLEKEAMNHAVKLTSIHGAVLFVDGKRSDCEKTNK